MGTRIIYILNWNGNSSCRLADAGSTMPQVWRTEHAAVVTGPIVSEEVREEVGNRDDAASTQGAM